MSISGVRVYGHAAAHTGVLKRHGRSALLTRRCMRVHALETSAQARIGWIERAQERGRSRPFPAPRRHFEEGQGQARRHGHPHSRRRRLSSRNSRWPPASTYGIDRVAPAACQVLRGKRRSLPSTGVRTVPEAAATCAMLSSSRKPRATSASRASAHGGQTWFWASIPRPMPAHDRGKMVAALPPAHPQHPSPVSLHQRADMADRSPCGARRRAPRTATASTGTTRHHQHPTAQEGSR